jgi:hypothetical protein
MLPVDRSDPIDKLYRLVQLDRQRWLREGKSTLSQLLEQIDHGIFAYRRVCSTMPPFDNANLAIVLKRLQYQDELARQVLENTKRLRKTLQRRIHAKQH